MSSSDVERRLSAILSADVVGYSRLMAANEDSTVRRLAAYREEIELHLRQQGGRLVDFVGDNFLAEFSSAVSATRFAVEIQRVLGARNIDLKSDERMELRIGLHVGEVRVEGDRLFGNGVNIAARLEGLARPGEICLSSAVRDQLAGRYEVETDDLGEQSLKNLADPIRVFKIRRSEDRGQHDSATGGEAIRPAAPSRRRAAGFEVRYAKRPDGVMTAYGVMGSGPVLIMPPGGLTHLEWYSSDTAAHEHFCVRLAERHTLVLYDRHGCGLSDRNRRAFTAEDDMLDLEAVVGETADSTFVFFGISWGGVPSVAYAAKHPERVRRMVLYGTFAPGPHGPGPEEQARLDAEGALRRTNFDLYNRMLASKYFPSGTDRETFQSLSRMLTESATPEIAEKLDDVYFDNQSLLPNLHTPTLVLHRRGDEACLFEWGQYIARNMPNARFQPLDGDAHFPWVDDADSVIDATLDFLAQD